MATLPHSSLFNADWYLTQYPDVAEAVRQGLITAEEHFAQFGNAEGRATGPLFNPEDYLAANPDVAAAVASGLMTAYDHFLQFGAGEGRSPLSLFDPEFYLSQNPDVAAAVAAGLMTATEHFLEFGQSEPRQINPFINLGDYLNANADLENAYSQGGLSPLTHLLTHGAAEGRDLGNGINLGMFANDPAFQEAISNGHLQAAIERAQDVAPFLPSFVPPPNWVPPADTPIPVDFVPPSGTTLVIPPSVVVPPDTVLPPSFEPVTPPAPPAPPVPPTPPAPPGGGGGGGDGPPPPPTIVVTKESLTAEFADSATAGTIQLDNIGDDAKVVVKGANLATLNVTGTLGDGGGAFYLDVGNDSKDTDAPDAAGNAAKLKTVNLGLTGDTTTVWQWGTNARDIETVDGAGSTAALNAAIHAGIGTVGLKNLSSGSGADKLDIDHAAFAEGTTLNINLGDGDDILSFDSTLPTTVPFTFNSENVKASMIIDGGAGNDKIDAAVGATVTGGAGDDEFIIRTSAAPGPDAQIIITDYNNGNDVIDVTKVLNLQDLSQLDVRQGGTETDAWTIPGTNEDTVIQFSGGSGTQLILEKAYGKTLKLAINDTGLTDVSAIKTLLGSDAPVYSSFLVNTANDATIQGTNVGEIISGGAGSQTLKGGSGNDIIIGGGGQDILSGEDGKDIFIFMNLKDSLLAHYDHITDLAIDTDILLASRHVTAEDVKNLGNAASLSAADIGNLLSTSDFTAYGAATFTIAEGTRTFVALNDGNAGFDATTDAIIEITGYSGDIKNLQIQALMT